VAQIVAGLPDPLKQRVSTLQFGGLDLGACDWHPSLADHEKLAKEVAAAAASLIPEWKADQGSTATD
jgi:hypothetical protein